MKIHIEEILEMVRKRKLWNSVPLKEIEFYENNKKIEIESQLIENFEFTGLNNIDFITTGCYKEK